jgi:hypothetical protein
MDEWFARFNYDPLLVAVLVVLLVIAFGGMALDVWGRR